MNGNYLPTDVFASLSPPRTLTTPRPQTLPFNFSLNTPEHLNVITRRGLNIRSSPVCGFLPLRWFFSLTSNLPNPVIITGPPRSKGFLNDFHRGLERLNSIPLLDVGSMVNTIDDMGFGQGHDDGLLQKVFFEPARLLMPIAPVNSLFRCERD